MFTILSFEELTEMVDRPGGYVVLTPSVGSDPHCIPDSLKRMKGEVGRADAKVVFGHDPEQRDHIFEG